MKDEFIKRYTFERRMKEGQLILDKYPGRVPIIIQSNDFTLDKEKFLVPDNHTMVQFVYFMRKRIHANSNEAIFMFVINYSQDEKTSQTLLPLTTSTMSTLYAENKHTDHFLYLLISKENTFG